MSAKKLVAKPRSRTSIRSSALWISGVAVEQTLVALGEEAVGDTVGEGVAKPPRVAEAREDHGHRGGARVVACDPALDPAHQLAVDRGLVADDLLGELDPPALGLGAQHLLDPLARRLFAEAGRDAAVDAHLGARGDHVDLSRGAGHRRRQRHTEHRLDQRPQPRVGLRDPLQRRAWVIGVLAEAAQQRRRAFGQLEGVGLVGERGQDRRELEQRVVSGSRQRRVAGGADGRDVEAEDPLLGAADPVMAPAVVLKRLAAALVDQHLAADLVGVVGGQPVCAPVTAGLLVCDEHELQRAPLGAPAFARQRHGRDRLGGDLRLHIQRAAAPQKAVGDLARPRVMPPLRCVGQHRVDVSEEAQRRAGLVADQVGDQVCALGLARQDLGLQARAGYVLL